MKKSIIREISDSLINSQKIKLSKDTVALIKEIASLEIDLIGSLPASLLKDFLVLQRKKRSYEQKRETDFFSAGFKMGIMVGAEAAEDKFKLETNMTD